MSHLKHIQANNPALLESLHTDQAAVMNLISELNREADIVQSSQATVHVKIRHRPPKNATYAFHQCHEIIHEVPAGITKCRGLKRTEQWGTSRVHILVTDKGYDIKVIPYEGENDLDDSDDGEDNGRAYDETEVNVAVYRNGEYVYCGPMYYMSDPSLPHEMHCHHDYCRSPNSDGIYYGSLSYINQLRECNRPVWKLI